VNGQVGDSIYPWRDDQTELAWVAWLNMNTVYPREVNHLSTNPAQCRVTLLHPTTLPLSQTATSDISRQGFKSSLLKS